MFRSESIVKIAAALVKAQSEMATATKDSKNPFFKSSYADLNAIREVVLPAFNKHGITVLQPTVVVDGKNYVETVLMHESGEFLSSHTEIKVAKQNDPQAEGSGISYARRYGLQSFVNAGAKDDDGEAATSRETKETPKRTVASFAKDAKKVETIVVSPAVAAQNANNEQVTQQQVKSVPGWD